MNPKKINTYRIFHISIIEFINYSQKKKEKKKNKAKQANKLIINSLQYKKSNLLFSKITSK